MRAFIGRLAHPEPGFDINHAAQSSNTEGILCSANQSFIQTVSPASDGVSFAGRRRARVDLFRFRRARGLRIAAGCAVVAVAAALDSILTAFALAPAFV